MSMLTYGPPISLNGSLPVPPLHSLLTVRWPWENAGPEGVLVPVEDEHYLNGAQIYGYPISLPETWDPCAEGTFRTKAEGEAFPVPIFASFGIYLPITCTALSISDPDEFRDRAMAALDARESWGVARALSRGLTGVANPFFADAAVSLPAASVAQSPEAALAYLEEAIGATGQVGMIHATPGPVSRWFDKRGLPYNGPLITPNGTPVASDGGYVGATPSGGSAAAAGQSWAFATGPVEVRHSDGDVLEISEVLERSLNDVTYRAERYVLATWDTALQAAVKVNWAA